MPFVPGSERGLELDAMERLAEQIGYPVMLKAAAGGGGKGMRLVHSPNDLHSAYESARSEAQLSIRLKPNAEAFLVLARLNLQSRDFIASATNVADALKLEPNNTAAQALRSTLQAQGQSVP